MKLQSIFKNSIKGIAVSLLLGTIALTACEESLYDGKEFKLYEHQEPEGSDLPEVLKIGKKGICYTIKSDTWSAKVSATKSHWHYSWGNRLSIKEPFNIDFVPMFWGGVSDDALEMVKELKAEGKIRYVLGFNEPDKTEQANMTVDRAIELWPKLEEIGLPLVSPAPSNYNNGWLEEFMTKADQNSYRVDYIGLHLYYGTNVQKYLDILNEVYQKYGKPIWITELAVADWDATTIEENKYSREDILTFMKALLPQLEELPYVYKYSWFSGAYDAKSVGTSALFDLDGNLTPLGEYYANFEANTIIGPGRDDVVDPDDNQDPVIIGENIIVNNGFEEGGGSLTGWTKVSDVGIEKVNKINGVASARLTGVTASDRQLFQTVTLESGKTYILNFTGRIQNGGGAEGTKFNDNGGELYAKIKFGDGEYTTLITLIEDLNTTKSGIFTVPAGVTEVTVNFMKNKDIAYIDDVEIFLVED